MWSSHCEEGESTSSWKEVLSSSVVRRCQMQGKLVDNLGCAFNTGGREGGEEEILNE